MRYKDDNIWSLFFEPEKRGERGQKRSQNLVTFTCPHRANLIKLQTEIDKIRNENDHPLPKEKERRVLFLEKKKRDHAHTDQCCAKYEGLSVNIPITVNLKESQLCQIRFNETTQAYEGMVHYLVSNKGRKKEILDTDWVKQNFDENRLERGGYLSDIRYANLGQSTAQKTPPRGRGGRSGEPASSPSGAKTNRRAHHRGGKQEETPKQGQPANQCSESSGERPWLALKSASRI